MDLYDMRKPLTEFGISIDPEHGHALRSEAMRSDYLDWHAADKRRSRLDLRKFRPTRRTLVCEDVHLDSGPHEGCSEWAESVVVHCSKPATHVVKLFGEVPESPEESLFYGQHKPVKVRMCKFHAEKLVDDYASYPGEARAYRFRRI